MAGSSQDNDDNGISGINVTPLVDIMLVLVIILFVTAEFSKYKLLPVKLPKIKAGVSKKEPHKVYLTVVGGGVVYWNDEKVEDIDTLQLRLKAEKSAFERMSVIIRGEKDTPYGELIPIIDEVRLAGISRIGLAGEKGKK